MSGRTVHLSERGASRLEVLVGLAVLMIVGGVLLERLTYYQEAAERIQMEAVARSLAAALQIRQAELVFAGRDGEIAALEGSNPFLLLQAGAPGYNGECARDRLGGATGWCFDSRQGEVLFTPRMQRFFHGPLPAFRVSLAYVVEKGGKVPIRVMLKLLYSYEWLGVPRAAGRWVG